MKEQLRKYSDLKNDVANIQRAFNEMDDVEAKRAQAGLPALTDDEYSAEFERRSIPIKVAVAPKKTVMSAVPKRKR